MATLDTRPISAPHTPTATHEHAWVAESRHVTSIGEVVYVRCTECGSRRVDIRHRDEMPPTALSRETAAAPPA